MRNIKKVLASLLIMVLVVTNVPIQKVMATDATSEVTVTNLICNNVNLIEGSDGYFSEEYDYETGGNNRYYRYSVYPTYTVTFSDGTVMSNQRYGTNYNGRYYSLSVSTDQSYSNQWGVGSHIAIATMGDITITFTVNIAESPIESITCNDVEIIEKTSGYYTTGYDSVSGENKEYYYYSSINPIYTVVFKDGTVLENQRYSIQFEGQYYSLNCSGNQSYEKQWTVGNVYSATASLMGAETTYEVTVLETPIESLTVEDATIIEGTNGEYITEYRPEGQVEYYRYNFNNVTYTAIFKDGTTITRKQNNGIEYNDQYYSTSVKTDQSYDNQWGIGTHEVTMSVLGVETTYNVNIIKSPYVSIEILNMSPVIEGEDCKIQGEDVIYNIPDFSYRVTHEDGTSFVGYFDGADEWWVQHEKNDQCVTVSSDQIEKPWTVGGDNYFTVSYLGTETKVKVEVQPSSPYEYYEENGGIFITNYKLPTDVLEIPSEIDGLPVVAILDLGYAVSTVKELIIPDSVTTIAQSALNSMHQLEKMTVGSGVSYLNEYMLWSWSLTEVVVSENNPYYCSKDGVVYDKAGTTIVLYPRGKGDKFIVPKEVVNADIMFSAYSDVELEFEEGSVAYIKEGGVLYSANKTKVISCDVDKTGEYIMPDTVTEILDWAFNGCTELTGVVVSKNVTSIAYRAFDNCTSLSNVELPTGLVTIERGAFGFCESLSTIKLPETVETIEKEAFEYSGVKNVSIPDSVTEMGERAFSCSELSEVYIGNGLKTISYEAFRQTKLKEVSLTDTVESIESYAFYNTPLEKIVLGNGLRKIGNDAFHTTKLKKLELPDSITDIGNCAFLATSITELVIPDSVVNLGYGVFAECVGLTDVTIGTGISHVSDGSFSQCTSLNKVVFKNESVTIGDGAFEGCPLNEINMENVRGSIGLGAFRGSGLKSVSLQEGVTEVVYDSFANSTALAEIDVPTSLVHVGGTAFDNTAWYNEQPEGMVYLEHILYKYKGALPNNAELTVQEGTTVLADNIFENNTNLVKINLPEGLLTIGDESFEECVNLAEISIPNTVEYIGDYAFKDSGLTELVIPASVQHIGEQVLTSVVGANIHVDPDNKYYTSIDGVLFNKDCTELIWCPKRTESTYTVPKTVTYIAPNAFSNSGVTELIVKNYYTELGDNAYGYEEVTEPTSNGQYLECKIVCYEKSLAEVYATKNLLTVDVVEEDPIVTGVAIESIPDKTVYDMGQSIDTTGLSLLVSYSNGLTKSISSGFELDKYSLDAAGEKTISVIYEGHSATFEVNVRNSGKVIIGNAKGRPGQEVDVTLSFEQAMSVKSMGISDLVYDESKLQLVSATWNCEGLLSDWNTDKNEGVLTFSEKTEVEQFFTLTFLVLEGAEDGEISISCKVIATEQFDNKVESNINLSYEYGTITVYNVLPGDMDGNDVVNSDDAIYLLYHTLMSDKYPANQDCDFNGDNMVNSDDAIYLLYYVMMPERYPINK